MMFFVTCEVSLSDSIHHVWSFPLINEDNVTATLFLVPMYLICIFWSKLIRSNNQSRITLCVLETCLIEGLFPLTIILITASLSSHVQHLDAKIERLREHRQYCSKRKSFLEITCYARDLFLDSQRDVLLHRGSELCFQGLKQSDPTNREREFRPISIGHPKRWLRILLECAKLKFVWTHNGPPEMDCESSRSLAIIGVLKNTVCIVL